MSKTTTNERIGRRLRILRGQQDISQASVAAACDVNQKTVSSWEHGTPMPAARSVAVADLLGVSLDYLLRGRRS